MKGFCKSCVRPALIAEEFSGYRFNSLTGEGKLGIVTQGVSTGYVGDALSILGEQGQPLPAHKLLRVATPHPFPEKLALDFLDGLDQVLVIEELDLTEIRTWDDFQRLPFSEKADLRNAYPLGLQGERRGIRDRIHLKKGIIGPLLGVVLAARPVFLVIVRIFELSVMTKGKSFRS